MTFNTLCQAIQTPRRPPIVNVGAGTHSKGGHTSLGRTSSLLSARAESKRRGIEVQNLGHVHSMTRFVSPTVLESVLHLNRKPPSAFPDVFIPQTPTRGFQLPDPPKVEGRKKRKRCGDDDVEGNPQKRSEGDEVLDRSGQGDVHSPLDVQRATSYSRNKAKLHAFERSRSRHSTQTVLGL